MKTHQKHGNLFDVMPAGMKRLKKSEKRVGAALIKALTPGEMDGEEGGREARGGEREKGRVSFVLSTPRKGGIRCRYASPPLPTTSHSYPSHPPSYLQPFHPTPPHLGAKSTSAWAQILWWWMNARGLPPHSPSLPLSLLRPPTPTLPPSTTNCSLSRDTSL